MQAVLDGNSWPVAQAALQVLAKLLGNISSCGNSSAKFRTVKCDNAAIAGKVLAAAGARNVLTLGGFRPGAENTLVFPEDTPLGKVRALAARYAPACFGSATSTRLTTVSQPVRSRSTLASDRGHVAVWPVLELVVNSDASP